MARKRTNYPPVEKVSILRRHLIEKVPVSEICDELNLKPTIFYRWQKEFFENGAAAFEPKRTKKQDTATEKKIQKLEERLQQKNEVVAELMEEHIKLKKNLGEI
jgi:transposase